MEPFGAEGTFVPVEGGLDVGDGDGDVIEPFDRHVRSPSDPARCGALILAQPVARGRCTGAVAEWPDA